MIVAITGGNGFIGRYLVRLHLWRGDVVRVLTRNAIREEDDGVELYCGDLTHSNHDLLSFVDGADVLYHCAAELNNVSMMNAVNVEGTARLIEVASGRVGRWVQLSSVGAYGLVGQGTISETTPERPLGLYEKTKTQADALVRDAACDGAFETVILRPSNVYGEDMPNKSLFQLFTMIERGWFFFIGPKGASANYVHVTDVVEALALCASHPAAAGRTFNLSNWDTMEALVESVAEALERRKPRLRLPLPPVRLLASTVENLPKVPITRARVDALSTRVCYSNSRIEQELNFMPQVSVCEGMMRLARGWRVA